MTDLNLIPVSFREACAFIAEHHRHHKPPRGMKFCLGLMDRDGELVGVATVGRPVARAFDDGLTLEVNRTCTDGTKNANSMLYGAAVACRESARLQAAHHLYAGWRIGRIAPSSWLAGVVAELAARPSWAESSVKLRAVRDPEGPGGVQRSLWEAAS